jgi:hypothetical protein
MHEKFNFDINSYFIYENGLTDSTILTPYQTVDLYELCEFYHKKSFKLLYRATRDGFSSQAFHSKCDKIPKTLTIIKVKDEPYIFGGYTKATWDGDGYKQDRNAFLFSLVNHDNKPIRMEINTNTKQAIYCNPSFGPTFGGGHDIRICFNSNTVKDSSSNLGNTYLHPDYHYNTPEAKEFLTERDKFSTSEIEVYQAIVEDIF